MISVSTKMTLLVLILPIISLVFLDAIIYYFHKTLTIEISDLLTTILVSLLVWERLRESLIKKLEYLNKNYFLELYEIFKEQDIIYQFPVRKLNKIGYDLERYGKFLTISLYPKDVLTKINIFLICYKKFNNKFSKIINIGKEKLERQFNMYYWLHLLGVRQLDKSYLQDKIGKSSFKLHENQANIIKEEQTKLVTETRNLHVEVEKIKREIMQELEEFLIRNGLKLESEPVRVLSPY